MGILKKMVKQARAEGQPKRPMSAYFLWMNTEGRAMVKKNNPDAPITEISKKCGEEWRSLDASDKKKFEKMQEEAKKKFEKEYKVWLENGGEELLKQAKKENKEKKENKGRKLSTGCGSKEKEQLRRQIAKKSKKKVESEEDEVSEDEESD